MNISAVDGLGSTLSGARDSSQKDKSMGREDFLTMLVAQIQNQDPLNPMEGTDFTAQLAQFSTLEQMIGVNSNLEGLQMIQTSQNNSQMLNLIGKTVEAEGNSVKLNADKSSDLHYRLDGNAQAVDIFIYNASGAIVRSISEVGKERGDHQVAWDGNDGLGNTLPEGNYTYVVSAKDSLGKDVPSTPMMVGEITGLSYNEDGSTQIWMDGLKINLSDISRVTTNSKQTI